jgi:hypothetical protein
MIVAVNSGLSGVRYVGQTCYFWEDSLRRYLIALQCVKAHLKIPSYALDDCRPETRGVRESAERRFS